MKQIVLVLMAGAMLASSSCKKSSSSPSIVGAWSLSGYSGTSSYGSNDSAGVQTSGNTTTYTYSNGTLTTSELDMGSSTPYITTIVVSEAYTFNSDGTYSYTETDTRSSSPTVTYTDSGTWDYLSNTQANSGFILNSGNSNGSEYTAKVVGNTLVISNNYTQKSNGSYGYLSSSNVTMTFTKQ